MARVPCLIATQRRRDANAGEEVSRQPSGCRHTSQNDHDCARKTVPDRPPHARQGTTIRTEGVYDASVVRPLRVGVQLPEVERDVRWPEYVAMARVAEAAGFDSIWVGDHLLYRDDGRSERGPWEAWTLLAGLAASTQRVRLGPLVTCAGFRPPGLLAKMAATVDEMSGGRLILGLGSGWNRAEFTAFGLPFDNRTARFEESFEIIRRLLAGDRVTFHGRFHQVDDAVLYPRPLRSPPLMVGSTGPRMLELTLPYVTAWNTWYEDYGNTPEGFDKLNAAVTRAAERAERTPGEIGRSACVLVTLDRAASERPIREGIRALEGPMDRVARDLREFAEAGADEAILVLNPITSASVHALREALDILDA
jgi:probable F420-dependent oxidoreductase